MSGRTKATAAVLLIAALVAACATQPTATPPATSPATSGPAMSGPATATSTSVPTTTSTSTISTSLSPATAACTDAVGQVDRLTFHSTVLAVDQPEQHYRVYTPRCYAAEPTRRYPVVYLLHGAQTDDSQWEAIGLFTTADRLIAAGTIAPLIIVLPDGIWAMGDYRGNPTGFDRFLRGEVLPTVERAYRVIDDPAHRALGGISRGGEWALLEGGRHPEVFGALGGHSPAVGPPGSPNPTLVPLLAANPGQRLWLDVAAGDTLGAPVASLVDALRAAGLAPEYHVSPGAHDRAYWSSQTEAYLRFYAAPW